MNRILSVTLLLAVLLTACADADPVAEELVGARSAAPTASEALDPAPSEPAGPLRLIPRAPEELGIPGVPEPAASTAAEAVTLARATAPYRDYGTDAEPGTFPREVTHSQGVTAIDREPQRIVVLDVGELDAMVQLGLVPVGAVEYNDFGLPPFILDQVRDVELVGTTAEPNLEAIAALEPDLILSSSLRHEELYDVLSGIAPTVFADRPGVTFKENFALYAQAVGREVEAARVVADYEARMQEVSAAIGETRPTISIVQLRPDSIRFYLRANFLGVVLTDVGLPRSPAQDVDDFAATLGEEALPEYVDGEAVLVAQAAEDTGGILDGEVWQSLPVVRAGDVVTVDSRTWIGGVGYGSAFEVLDGLEAEFG